MNHLDKFTSSGTSHGARGAIRSAVLVAAMTALQLMVQGCATSIGSRLHPARVTETSGCSLCVSAYQGDLTKTTYLLKHGANPNATFNGRSPLDWAILSKTGVRWDIVLLLLHYDANPNIALNSGLNLTPLIFAAAPSGTAAADARDLRALEALIKAGADVNARNSYGDTALTESLGHADSSSLVRVADLLKAKADPDIRNAKGASALDLAVDDLWRRPGSPENIPIVRMLLAAGAKPQTALEQLAILMRNGLATHGSVPAGTHEALRLLLAYGAKPQEVRDPLLLSVIGDRPDLAEMLINAGDPVDLCDKHGESAVDIAIRRDDIEQAKLLFRFGAGLNEVYAGDDPLLDAYADGNLPMIRLLIRHGSFNLFVNQHNQYDWHPDDLIKDKLVKNEATEALYGRMAKPVVEIYRLVAPPGVYSGVITQWGIGRNAPPSVFRAVLARYEEEPLKSPLFRGWVFSMLSLRPELMPPVPERAMEDAALGNALWRKAKTRTDVMRAAEEYEEAAEAAPWVGAYQRNLCILEYAAGEYRRADVDCDSNFFPSDKVVQGLEKKVQSALNAM